MNMIARWKLRIRTVKLIRSYTRIYTSMKRDGEKVDVIERDPLNIFSW